jgi:hypothetical protein
MTRLQAGRPIASVYAAACFAVVLAPALAVRWTTLRAGVGGAGGIVGWDLVAASAVVGAGHARAGLQLVAVGLAEATGRLVFWWLEPDPGPERTCRWGVLPPARGLVRRVRLGVDPSS